MRCWSPTHFSTWKARRRCCEGGDAEHLRHERDVLEDRARENQLEILEHEPDAATVFLDLSAGELRQVAAVNEDFAFTRALLEQQEAK